MFERVIISLCLTSVVPPSDQARIMTCIDCFEDPKNFRGNFPWKGGVSTIKDYNVYNFNMNDKVTLSEIMVPTCSYRMGVPMMGYGSALIGECCWARVDLC